MKLSKQTLDILKELSSITTTIALVEGNVISCRNQAKTIMAYVTIPDKLDFSFNLYDTPEFLSMMSLFNEPELIFEDNYVVIKDAMQSIKYHNSADNLMVGTKAPATIKFPDADVSFSITKPQMDNIMKSANVFKTEAIAFKGDGKTLKAVVIGDKKSDSSNTYSIEVGMTDKVFTSFFKKDDLKLPSNNYDIDISAKGIARFLNSEIGSTYYVAVQADSTFEV